MCQETMVCSIIQIYVHLYESFSTYFWLSNQHKILQNLQSLNTVLVLDRGLLFLCAVYC